MAMEKVVGLGEDASPLLAFLCCFTEVGVAAGDTLRLAGGGRLSPESSALAPPFEDEGRRSVT